MPNKRIFILIATVFLFASPAHSLVDLKSANFADAWVDLAIQGTGYDLKVQRGYNSRTLFNGMFGFGWCSDFETALDVTPEGNLKLTECGAGMEVSYISPNFSEKDIDKTVKQIMEKARAENPSAPAGYFTELDKRLKTDLAARSEYAAKYGITRGIPDKTKYIANGVEADVIEKQGNNFVRTVADGGSQRFKLNGKLEKVFDRNGNYLTFTYDGKFLRDITDNNGRKLSFNYYENGKVKTITGPGGIKAEYKFKNLNDLVYAKAPSGNIYTYEYDELHNMTKIIYPDKRTKQMGYNKNKDWITSFKDIDACLESYDYQQSADDPKNHFFATVQKKCGAKVVVKAKYEFWYVLKSDRTEKYLKRSRTQENDQVTDIAYNETGKPLHSNKNGKVTKYEYYDNGLLKKKVTPDGIVTLFKYDNPFKKVSHVERAGKSSDFVYDTKGNLIKANNSDGQKINITYDVKGRMLSIEDQARRKVNLKYDERFGKASVIEREGVGSISIVYNSKGDIQKVMPGNGGATVATQVASTFYNLLDLIQPSGVNLTF